MQHGLQERAEAPIGRMLLIDDSGVDLLIGKAMIERSGLVGEVVGFGNAGDALDYLRRYGPDGLDLILLDIEMPGMGGFAFLEAACRELPATFANVAVIMLTASLSAEDINRASSFEMVIDFLSKPIKPDYVLHICHLLQARASF